MARRKNTSLYLSDEEIKLLRKASELAGLNQSALCRSAVLERAREIISEGERNGEKSV
jgi:uncharacterized protein (DUF1778 family)